MWSSAQFSPPAEEKGKARMASANTLFFLFFHSCWSTTLSPRFKMETSPTTINCKTMMEMFCAAYRWWSWKKMFLRPEFVTWNFSHSTIDCTLNKRGKKRLRRCPNRLPIVMRLQEKAFFLRFVNISRRLPPEPDSSHSTVTFDPKKKGDAKSITKISHSNRQKVAR